MGFYGGSVASGTGQSVLTTAASQTASFTAAANTYYPVSASSGAITVTLPTSTTYQSLLIKKTDTSTNAVTLSGTINGTSSATYAMSKQYQAKELYADGSGGWNIIGGDLDLTGGSATTTTLGFVQLAGDLGGTATAPTVPTKVAKAGDTMTGNLVISAAASRVSVSNTTLTQYYNASLLLANASSNMASQAGTLLFSGINDTGISQGYFGIARVDLNGNNATNVLYIDYNGGYISMYLPLGMNSQKISQLATPTNTTDATNKSYVDAGDLKAGTQVSATNVQTASYTLALADAGAAVEMNSTSATTVTVPANATVAFPVGTIIEIAQYGTGQVTVAAASGVTLRTASSLTTRAQYSSVTLRQRAANEWMFGGDMT